MKVRHEERGLRTVVRQVKGKKYRWGGGSRDISVLAMQ